MNSIWPEYLLSQKESSVRARNALTVTQRACLLIEHGNRLKSRKVAWSDGRQRKRRHWKDKKKLDGEHFISDDTCVSMAVAELQSATMTKKENHSSCQPALEGLCEKTLEAPFSQECLLNRIMRVNRKQMCMFSSSAAVCDVHYLWRRSDLMLLLKHKQEEEVKYCTGSVFWQY